MALIQCKGCSSKQFKTCLFQGYCGSCTIRQLELCESMVEALEPIKSWYDDNPAGNINHIVRDLQNDRTELFEVRKANAQLKLELCDKREMALLNINLTKQIEKLNEQELRRVAELHEVYTEKANLKADLERALKDVAMFEDLASKAETARVIRLETCLREIAKSPNWRGVPNWVVLKIQEVIE